MIKKLFFTCLLFAGLLGGLYFFIRSNSPVVQGYCAFCDPAILKAQTFYEDDLVLALYTHKPIVPGHFLIIPKRHVERFEMLSDAEITQIGRVIKKVNAAAVKIFDASAYLLLQKNGAEVGQTVPHVHFHYIPRKAGENSVLIFMFKMYLSSIRSPISAEEMQHVVEQMKEAIEVYPNG